MARTYIDLLAFPAGAGGRDTPSRLGWVAAYLGYSIVGILWRGRRTMPHPEIRTPGIQLVRVAEEGASSGPAAELRVAFGKRAGQAATAGTVDYVVPTPNDMNALRSAADNKVPVAYPYALLLKEQGVKRSHLIRAWCRMHEYCGKQGCPEILVSGADDSYLMRDPRDLASALRACLGLPPQEALDWITSTPQDILARARERGGG